MSMGSRIRELRELRRLSRNELAQLIEVSPSAISNYENDLSAPKEEILYRLFDVLKCDANYLYQDYMDGIELFTTTFDEQELIRKIRLMDNYDLETLNLLADRLLAKYSGKKAKIISISQPVFDMAVSAGTGQFLDSDKYELVDFPEEIIPRDSNFAVRVSGDSMEPTYKNGSIVFVKQTKELLPGDIGIFILNNEGYLKIFGNNSTLKSINPKYQDIRISEWDDCRVVGKVVGSYQQ